MLQQMSLLAFHLQHSIVMGQLRKQKEMTLLRKFGLQATKMVLRSFVLLRLGDLLLYLRYLVQDPHNEAGGRGASTIDRK